MVPDVKKSAQTPDEKKVITVPYFEAVGRRKTSSCRVRLYAVKDEAITIKGQQISKGSVIVNGKKAETYFPGEIMKKILGEPFRTTNTMSRFAVSATVRGGGPYSQLGAFVHAVSRALQKVDVDKFKPILRKRGFLTRDQRARERRKAGHAGKARAGKQSPKR